MQAVGRQAATAIDSSEKGLLLLPFQVKAIGVSEAIGVRRSGSDLGQAIGGRPSFKFGSDGSVSTWAQHVPVSKTYRLPIALVSRE